MIITLKELAKCRRCGSANTVAQMVVPSECSELRGMDSKETVEVMCKECGKIDRKKRSIKIE
ncbi:MAG: hypothetical protein ACLFQ8_02255 [Candidatus Aenigmatarchaeota archaeon]